MKTYEVTYIQQLSRDYLVNANSEDEAKEALLEAVAKGIVAPDEVVGNAMVVCDCDEDLPDDEVDATSSNGLWNQRYNQVRLSGIPDALPNDLTGKHYMVTSYDTYEDKISVYPKIFSKRSGAVDVLQKMVKDVLVSFTDCTYEKAEATLHNARHGGCEHPVCEYDNFTDTAKVHYSAAGDETTTFQISEI